MVYLVKLPYFTLTVYYQQRNDALLHSLMLSTMLIMDFLLTFAFKLNLKNSRNCHSIILILVISNFQPVLTIKMLSFFIEQSYLV